MSRQRPVVPFVMFARAPEIVRQPGLPTLHPIDSGFPVADGIKTFCST